MPIPLIKIILALTISICIIIGLLWLTGSVHFDWKSKKHSKKFDFTDWLADKSFELCVAFVVLMPFTLLLWLVGMALGVNIFDSTNYQ